MKILIASTPGTGHVNPVLAVARILMTDGHEVAIYTGSAFRARVEAAGAKFFSLPPDADFDLTDPFARVPELKVLPPGLDWLRVCIERVLVDNILPQHEGLRRLLHSFGPDVIIGDDMFFGVLPMLLGARSKRPPIVQCGTSILHWPREDGAPLFLGLPPATTPKRRAEYAAVARDYHEVVDRPVGLRLNKLLKELGVGPTNSRVIVVRRARHRRCCCATMVFTWRSRLIAVDWSDAMIRRASPTWCWNRPSPPSWISKTASPQSMRRTRSRSIAIGWV